MTFSVKFTTGIFEEADEAARLGEGKATIREIAAALNAIAPPGEEITEGMVAAAQKNLERVAGLTKSPEGKYKVIGVDHFSGEDWVVGEYDTPEEALRIAEGRTEDAKESTTDVSVATIFYAYDPKGNYLGGDTWQPGERGKLRLGE